MKLKQGSTLFLRAVISLIGIVTLIAMLWLPQLEGRAADLDLIHIYADPLILYVYAGSIPFFAALYQAFKLLGYVDKNMVFSQPAVQAVRRIKYCALALPVLIMLGEFFIVFGADGDDFAGPVALGVYTTFASLVIATAAAVFEKILQNAVDIKSENELTV